MIDVLELWIILHSHPEIEISFKFIPKLLMSKEYIQFLGHSIYVIIVIFLLFLSSKQPESCVILFCLDFTVIQ